MIIRETHLNGEDAEDAIWTEQTSTPPMETAYLHCDRCGKSGETFYRTGLQGGRIEEDAALRRIMMERGWFRAPLPGSPEVRDWCPGCAADHPMAIAVRPRKGAAAEGGAR